MTRAYWAATTFANSRRYWLLAILGVLVVANVALGWNHSSPPLIKATSVLETLALAILIQTRLAVNTAVAAAAACCVLGLALAIVVLTGLFGTVATIALALALAGIAVAAVVKFGI